MILDQMGLFKGDATHFGKCKASITQVRGTFPRALYFELTGWPRCCWNNI